MGSEKNNGESFLRQLSLGGGGGGGGGGWNYSSPSYNYHHCSSTTKGGGSNSKRWGKKSLSNRQMEEEEKERGTIGVMMKRKRVMVVIDHSTMTKQAMMWALTHITNRGDLLTLLHVIPHNQNQQNSSSSSSSTCIMEDAPNLANSLGSLCKACKPEVEVEALVIQGPKLATVLSQVNKLEATVLVLSQSNPSPFCCLFRSSNEEFVEQCMNKAECLTMAVRKRSKGIGGYLVSTRWQKNFWLLA